MSQEISHIINPLRLDIYQYIKSTPTLGVRLLYFTGLITWILVLYGFSPLILNDPFFYYFIGPILALITIYHFISFGINLAYKQFNLAEHEYFIADWSQKNSLPDIDIFLPICGEGIEILKNTWLYVSQLNYPKNKLNIYVLDDSKENIKEHKELAAQLKFNYIERPNKGEMKKAGNLKYAYERTNSEFIIIFDADFAPHPDFIKHTLPYTQDKNNGIIQTPQYFIADKYTYKYSWISYCAAFQEEFFYRITQVARDKFNSAICCGSNALYRRQALDAIGGPRQVDASEDSRTGFALLEKGYVTRYIPIILATGLCPNDVYAYFHQQHRWCRGRSLLITSKEFINSKVGIMIKICNLSGFLSFLVKPLEIILSFQLFWVLFFYQEHINLSAGYIFYPFIIFSLILIPALHQTTFNPRVFIISTIQFFSTSHSIISVLLNQPVGWIATNAKHKVVSKAFVQTLVAIALYLITYLSLCVFLLSSGYMNLDSSLSFVYFWLVWNLLTVIATAFLLYSTYYKMTLATKNYWHKFSILPAKNAEQS